MGHVNFQFSSVGLFRPDYQAPEPENGKSWGTFLIGCDIRCTFQPASQSTRSGESVEINARDKEK